MTESQNNPRIHIRQATIADSSSMLSLVDALADYEKLQRPNAEAKVRLIADCFGERPRFDALLAEFEGKAVGYAFYFETYSSFLALPTLYLEDLFVLPEYRKQKIGVALFKAVAKRAHERGCGRMEWTVLDWNELAINFYNRLGAKHLNDWQIFRLTRAELAPLIDS